MSAAACLLALLIATPCTEAAPAPRPGTSLPAPTGTTSDAVGHAAELRRTGEPAEALAEARAATRRAPDSIEAHATLAEAALALDREDEAERAVQWMLDLRPRSPAALALGARLRARWGDIDGALAMARDALALTTASSPRERARALVAGGIVLRRAGRHEEAATLLRAALELEPGEPLARRELEALQAEVESPAAEGADGTTLEDETNEAGELDGAGTNQAMRER